MAGKRGGEAGGVTYWLVGLLVIVWLFWTYWHACGGGEGGGDVLFPPSACGGVVVLSLFGAFRKVVGVGFGW